MAFGFRKSIKLAPGVRVTLSKRGASVSGGPGREAEREHPPEKRASLGWLGTFWRKRL